MSHQIYRVVQFTITGLYQLQVGFDDGSSQEIDFEPILKGPLFGPLRDVELFNQVSLHPEMATLVWPNGADLDPATLHDWSSLKSDLQHMADRWEKADASV